MSFVSVETWFFLLLYHTLVFVFVLNKGLCAGKSNAVDFTKAELCKYCDYYVNIYTCKDDMSKSFKTKCNKETPTNKTGNQNVSYLFIYYCTGDN